MRITRRIGAAAVAIAAVSSSPNAAVKSSPDASAPIEEKELGADLVRARFVARHRRRGSARRRPGLCGDAARGGLG